MRDMPLANKMFLGLPLLYIDVLLLTALLGFRVIPINIGSACLLAIFTIYALVVEWISDKRTIPLAVYSTLTLLWIGGFLYWIFI